MHTHEFNLVAQQLEKSSTMSLFTRITNGRGLDVLSLLRDSFGLMLTIDNFRCVWHLGTEPSLISSTNKFRKERQVW